MTTCQFSVVESRWWDKGNDSVRSLFEAVASIHYNNPTSFFYDMFSDRTSLSTVLKMRGQDKQTQVIYLATHGDANNIGPNATNVISRTAVRNIMTEANKTKQLKGLYFGTCMTGNAALAKYLLENSKTNLEWVAGYRDTVDWIDGSAIDMIFFSKLAELYVKNKSKKRGKLSPRKIAHKAASELVKLVPGAHSTYGFNIYFHENKKLTSMFS